MSGNESEVPSAIEKDIEAVETAPQAVCLLRMDKSGQLTMNLEKPKTSPQKSPFVCQIPPRIQKVTPKSPELKKPSCTLTLGKGGIVTLKNQRVAQTILVTPTAVKQKAISPEKEIHEIQTSESEDEEKPKKVLKVKLKPKRKTKFNCEKCNFGFTRKDKLEQHKTSVHDGVKPFECEFESCGSTFARKFELQKHVSIVHDKIMPIKRFKCTVHPCEAAFSHKGHWSEHLKKIHGEKNPYKCEICSDVEFATKNELTHHKKRVHDVKIKAERFGKMIQADRFSTRFSCDICLENFTSKQEIKEHLKFVHEGRKPYKCELCSAKFEAKHHLKVHIAGNHQCRKCSKVFASKVDLNFHIREKHKEIKKPMRLKVSEVQDIDIEEFIEQDKPHVCEYCDVKFSQEEYLQTHISVVHKREYQESFHNKALRQKPNFHDTESWYASSPNRGASPPSFRNKMLRQRRDPSPNFHDTESFKPRTSDSFTKPSNGNMGGRPQVSTGFSSNMNKSNFRKQSRQSESDDEEDLVPIQRESSPRKAKEGHLAKKHMQEQLLEDNEEGGFPGLDLSDSDDDATWDPLKEANNSRSRFKRLASEEGMESYRSVVSTPKKANTLFYSPNEGASPQSFHDDTEPWQTSSPKEEGATSPNQTSFHECQLCYATFSQKKQLSQHFSLLHCGLVPHSCNSCEAKFVQKHHLKAHIEGMYINY
jgi:hypothetical protein